MIIVKAVRTVFIAQGHIDFGGTPNDRTITKELYMILKKYRVLKIY